ncbi:prenylated rab acceptor PRA1 [Rhizopogon vinicolor AM-OR11-026]|uniref:PRA1 family protein n=1 Tax=Rhizopogon vinicolor AM-OR11-026 TaxID=1314800 RepID=A0A1B7N5F9_9AGAM|nr:prenylated rab acceptor PRA1 [Rhizopogon vinicolor AM-OR11-026]
MEAVLRVTDALKSFRETRLSTLRPPTEFFDFHRISRPADLTQAVSRLTYNTRYFSGNYTLIVAALAVYAIITSPLLLISLVFLFGGFTLINRFFDDQWSVNVAGHVVTQKTLYMGLFVIGIPLLWFSSPFMTFFWLVGASSCLIIGHACLIEPGVESEYANIEGAV